MISHYETENRNTIHWEAVPGTSVFTVAEAAGMIHLLQTAAPWKPANVQRAIRATTADEDIAEGRVHRFNSATEMLASLSRRPS